MHNLKDIITINNNLVKNGKIQSFKEQVFDLMTGHYNLNRMMIISTDSTSLSYIDGITKDKIITISPNKILKVMAEHNLSFYDISSLDYLLKDSVMALDSLTQESSRVIVLDKKDIEDNQMIAICRTDAKNIFVNVNQITSIYGKKNFEDFLNRTYEKGKNIYVNEKTIEFTSMQGLQLPNQFVNSIAIKEYNTKILENQEKKEKEPEFEL